MNEEQPSKKACDSGQDDGKELTPEQMVQCVEAMGVKLPLDEWKRLGSLQLVGVDSERFKKVKERVEQTTPSLESELKKGDIAALKIAALARGKFLREELEKPRSESEAEESPASEAETEAGAEPDQKLKRLQFLWGTTYLLQAFAEALGSSDLAEDDAQRIRTGVQNVLEHSLRALDAKKWEGPVVTLPTCDSCIVTYRACKLPPATCQANYSYCATHCTP